MIKHFYILFLKKATPFFHIDLQYFFKGSFFGFIQQIVGVFCGLILSYLFGHFVSKQVFGEFNFVLSLLSMITFLSLPGVDSAMIKSIADGYDSSYVRAQRLKMHFSFIGSIFLLFTSIFYLFRNNETIGVSLLLCSLVYPLLFSFNIFPSFLIAKKRFSTLAFLSIVSSIVFLLTSATLIVLTPSTPYLIIGYLIGSIIPSYVAFNWAKRFIDNKNEHEDADLKNYSSFLTVLSILPWISSNMGSILVGTLLGFESLAVYSVANRFLAAIQKNFMVFYKPISAKLAYQSAKEHIETLKQHAIKLIGIRVGLAIVFWFINPPLIRFFFTDKYNDAILPSQLLSLSVIPLPLSWVLSDTMIYQKRKRTQIIISIIPEIVQIILYFIFIPMWNIYGLITVILIKRIMEPLIPLISLFSTRFSIKIK